MRRLEQRGAVAFTGMAATPPLSEKYAAFWEGFWPIFDQYGGRRFRTKRKMRSNVTARAARAGLRGEDYWGFRT
jgi:hypothetical protein